ncbi:MAG: helix-turn-helix transcriptional regulator [Firmicutes bacterium]|jgi:transcriptional regulator with XRE-family HTH domain|nr:helix-turn-helix transcriptional regulator [Bacillota bacterium]
MKEIERLQEHLLLIRRAAGWTAEEFGERIGVTRQTINNLEAKRNKLNKTQYIAIRTVLDAEMVGFPEDTEMLKCLLDVFIDNPDKYNSADRKALLAKANMLTPSILAGTTTRKDVSKEFVSAVGALGLATALATIPVIIPEMALVGGTSAWLQKAIKDKK